KPSGLSASVTSAPTLAVANTGGKPAASFTGGAGAAPFSVSSAKKVTSLNADLLDGINSSSFAKGAAHFYSGTAMNEPVSATEVSVLAVPGIATISALCRDSNANRFPEAAADVSFVSSAQGTQVDEQGAPGSISVTPISG